MAGAFALDFEGVTLAAGALLTGAGLLIGAATGLLAAACFFALLMAACCTVILRSFWAASALAFAAEAAFTFAAAVALVFAAAAALSFAAFALTAASAFFFAFAAASFLAAESALAFLTFATAAAFAAFFLDASSALRLSSACFFAAAFCFGVSGFAGAFTTLVEVGVLAAALALLAVVAGALLASAERYSVEAEISGRKKRFEVSGHGRSADLIWTAKMRAATAVLALFAAGARELTVQVALRRERRAAP